MVLKGGPRYNCALDRSVQKTSCHKYHLLFKQELWVQKTTLYCTPVWVGRTTPTKTKVEVSPQPGSPSIHSYPVLQESPRICSFAYKLLIGRYWKLFQILGYFFNWKKVFPISSKIKIKVFLVWMKGIILMMINSAWFSPLNKIHF